MSVGEVIRKTNKQFQAGSEKINEINISMFIGLL